MKTATRALLAPVAKRIPHPTNHHGEVLEDPYFWMRNRDDPDLIPYLEAENAFADQYMADTVALQKILYSEMRGRIKEADQTVPSKKGRWLYFVRTAEGEQYQIFCRRLDQPGSREEVLIDVNLLARGSKFFQIGGLAVSPDGNLLAYTYDNKGAEEYTLVVKDLRTGELLSSTAERVSSVVWANDNATLFYVTTDPVTSNPNRLFRHELGTSEHHLIHVEADESVSIELSRSRTGAFIYLKTGNHTTAAASFIEADKPLSAFREIVPRQPMIRHNITDDGKNFYILTDLNAKNFRLVKTPCRSPAPPNWQEVIPHRDDVKLLKVDVFADFFAVHELSQGLTKVRIQTLGAGGDVHYIDFPEPVYDVGGGDNHEFAAGHYRLEYESMVTPPSTFDYDPIARRITVLKTKEVNGYQPGDYKCERIFATSDDGTPVPMTVVCKKDLKLDGGNLCHLTGYGAYGVIYPTYFSVARLSLLDRGFIYAIGHMRGGGEGGEDWIEGGKMKNKMNTFKDFIACAEHLIESGYTNRERLTIEGRSAGGLLMGAVLNLRPDLFKAAVLGVPFVDVINTMSDASLPLTVGEYLEWGNPANKDEYDAIRAYSPYENIAAADYPAILVRSAFHDKRVSYWEPAKWVARMRAISTGNNPLIFKILLEAGGHGGNSGRFDALEDVAFDYAFILKQVGLL